MKYIDSNTLTNIEKNLFNKARDIDVCLYNGLFYEGQGFNEMILDALTAFQNKDGGFGNGLYIDNYDTNSSVYQTYEALRLIDISFIEPKTDNELYPYLLNKIGNYLYNRCEIIENKWNPFIDSTKNYAHSNLFENTKENRKLFGVHPTLAIVGYTLKLYPPTKAYYKKALKMANALILELLNKDSYTKYEFISINSFLNSVKDLNLFSNLDELKNKVINVAKKNVTLDFANYDAILPLDVALYINDDKELNNKKDEQLDFIINSIANHGLWEYNRSWGNSNYPEEDSAKLKWLGAITVKYLYILTLYSRIK